MEFLGKLIFLSLIWMLPKKSGVPTNKLSFQVPQITFSSRTSSNGLLFCHFCASRFAAVATYFRRVIGTCARCKFALCALQSAPANSSITYDSIHTPPMAIISTLARQLSRALPRIMDSDIN